MRAMYFFQPYFELNDLAIDYICVLGYMLPAFTTTVEPLINGHPEQRTPPNKGQANVRRLNKISTNP